MTFERYMELNRLADRLIADQSRHTAAGDEPMLSGVNKRERKALHGMIFLCQCCARWFDHKAVHEFNDKPFCLPCRSATV